MGALGSLILFLLLVAFIWWRQKCDRKRYGAPTREDRYKTIVIALCCLFILLGLAYWGKGQYTIASIMVVIFYQVAGVGAGRHGWYRQSKDGLFLGWVASLPLTIIWLSRYANT